MASQILLLDRVEFTKISVEANIGKFPMNSIFPQLLENSDQLDVLTRSDLIYSHETIEDPRHFVLVYGVKIASSKTKETKLPYEIEVETAGYFRYIGGDEFKDERRFRAVRFSGYQILYGAIREMVSNLTARSRHGLWHLPARNFGTIAESRAKEDEAKRQKILAARSLKVALDTPKKARKPRPKKST